MALYALAWMFAGYVFAINLFVGVVVNNFSRLQAEQDGSVTMTLEQKQWANTMKALAGAAPTKAARPPSHPLRLALYRLVHSRAFDSGIMAVIVANVGAMTTDYWGIEKDGAALANYEVRAVLSPHPPGGGQRVVGAVYRPGVHWPSVWSKRGHRVYRPGVGGL
eukprot:5218523-Prymnesium_polylepis.1